jgi:hypothetical protein
MKIVSFFFLALTDSMFVELCKRETKLLFLEMLKIILPGHLGFKLPIYPVSAS